jgi:hypothetical protein
MRILRILGWVAGSLFVAWHALVLAITPAPPSYLKNFFHELAGPYVRLFQLESGWGFFAPEPVRGKQLRYVVLDARQRRQEYRLTESLQRSSPAYLRYTTLFGNTHERRPRLLDSAAQYLCRRHAGDDPRSITFVIRHQLLITPEEYEAGKRSLTPEFLKTETLAPVPCRSVNA